MKAIPGIALTLAIALVGGVQKSTRKDGYVPKEGFAPTKDVAIKIAVAVWEPIYGAENIARKKPFEATLAEGVWTVKGSLPEGAKGGVPLAEISKEDGRIIYVSHGK